MKKIDLHLHLDGSLRIETVAEILNISFDEAKKHLVGKNLNNLNEYLKRFDYPTVILQTKENLTRAMRELCYDLIKDDVCYAEVRFAPILHTKNGLSLEEVVDAVLDGICGEIKINLILCMMRGFEFEDNLKIINLYLNKKDNRIKGLDLAGAEALFPNKLYKDLFDIINQNNIPFTIHSGEALGSDSVDYAIMLKAKRIGHGIRVIEDFDIVKKLIDNNILLEICPTSNVDTFSVKKYEDNPIYELYKSGVLISINTDDRTVSNITLEEEYNNLKKYFPFTDDDFRIININALKHSFIDEDDMEEIIKKLEG